MCLIVQVDVAYQTNSRHTLSLSRKLPSMQSRNPHGAISNSSLSLLFLSPPGLSHRLQARAVCTLSIASQLERSK